MQTFMKDSKSSRKAAGIPREKQQKMCAFLNIILFLAPVLEYHVREMESYTFWLQSMSKLHASPPPGPTFWDNKLFF